jgi:hypothetical protein
VKLMGLETAAITKNQINQKSFRICNLQGRQHFLFI